MDLYDKFCRVITYSLSQWTLKKDWNNNLAAIFETKMPYRDNSASPFLLFFSCVWPGRTEYLFVYLRPKE